MATYNELKGRAVFDSNNEKVGTLDEFYLDEDTNRPTWITVKTGLFGTKSNFVPLVHAQPTDDGLQVAFTKDQIHEAPKVDVDDVLEQDDEGELYSYYRQLEGGNAGTDNATTEDTTNDRSVDDDTNPSGDTDTTDDTDTLTRSEEQLHVDKQTTETGRVRLRKYVVTEDVNFTVPVSHEEVRVVREPIDDVHPVTTGDTQLGEETRDVTLHAEQVNINKTVTPVEKVTLEKNIVQEQRQVNDTVQKEQIDVDGDDSDSQEKPRV